jgi:hypothetical protein
MKIRVKTKSLIRNPATRDHLAFRHAAWQTEKAAGGNSSDLRPIWLPAVDALLIMFYAPTVEMKITFELLRQTRYPL